MSTQKGSVAGLVFCGITAVLEAATLVLYIMNANQTYYQDMNGAIAAMFAAALVCTVASYALSNANGGMAGGIVADVLRVAAPVLLFYGAVAFAGGRVQSLAQIFGSNLELGNESAFIAGKQAIVTIVVGLVAWLVSVVASFFKLGKRNI